MFFLNCKGHTELRILFPLVHLAGLRLIYEALLGGAVRGGAAMMLGRLKKIEWWTQKDTCIRCMVLVIPDCTAQIFFLIKKHYCIVTSWLLFSCIRLQPFYPSNRKSWGIFRGLTGTQMFTRSLCVLQSVSWNEATAGEFTSNTWVSISHEQFDFYVSHILHLQNSSDELQSKCAITLRFVKKFWIQLKVMTALTFPPEFQEQPGVKTGSRTTVPPSPLSCRLVLIVNSIYVAQWVG